MWVISSVPHLSWHPRRQSTSRCLYTGVRRGPPSGPALFHSKKQDLFFIITNLKKFLHRSQLLQWHRCQLQGHSQLHSVRSPVPTLEQPVPTQPPPDPHRVPRAQGRPQLLQEPRWPDGGAMVLYIGPPCQSRSVWYSPLQWVEEILPKIVILVFNSIIV